MRRSMLKRVCIAFLQHILAIGVLLAVAVIVLNSYIEVESIDGTKIYKIFPNDNRQEFEDSDIYQDLFRNAVSDITQLVVIRNQFETDGQFDPSKKISVTQFASNIGADEGCAVSAYYELDDLIKWGRYGTNLGRTYMSKSQFVNYFGKCVYPENFAIDAYGQLVFDGFHRVGDDTLDTGLIISDANGFLYAAYNNVDYGRDPEDVLKVYELMQKLPYTTEQYEDMIFAYIMAQNLQDIEVSKDDSNSIRIVVPIISCRYSTTTGETKLTSCVNNWVDYIRLQKNLISTIEAVKVDYQRYQVCNTAYKEGRSNVKYVVRMTTDNGVITCGNISELNDAEDEEITEVISEYRRYLIYYPDSLDFMGNTIMSEEEFYKYLKTYDYAYTDSTHIWMGVDTNYTIPGDAFYNANAMYGMIVPQVGNLILSLFVLTFLWLTLGIYRGVTTGVTVNENGDSIVTARSIDKIWTEILFLAGAGLGYGAYKWYLYLIHIAEEASMTSNVLGGMQFTQMYQYGMFGTYGLYLSMALCVIVYSFVRRVKCNILWTGSFFCFILKKSERLTRFVFRHRNAMISVMLPYNIYIFANICGAIGLYRYQEKQVIFVLILLGIVVFNGIVGVLLFKQHAERNAIIDGINRIRNGEVDFVINAEALHGANRELADAVNNIGEGIRKAVKTSMKDEQMKTDLITNVSHDIKTPLTSIINYVDLLKRLRITEEPAKAYIDILDTKAHRLKQLTDDLVEASKISSGNIILNMEKLNITELMKQGIGEFSEKMEESRLTPVFEKSNVPAYILADSRRMWRVLENLLNNLCKYAMENTRVYFDIDIIDGFVEASVKNISKQQMNIKPEELTERFIRGDSARSTEGSGLGLSIAKSLVQAQGGEFIIYLDGDLFKITLKFPVYAEEGSKSEIEEGELSLTIEENK